MQPTKGESVIRLYAEAPQKLARNDTVLLFSEARLDRFGLLGDAGGLYPVRRGGHLRGVPLAAPDLDNPFARPAMFPIKRSIHPRSYDAEHELILLLGE